MVLIARFHAQDGQEAAAEEALREVATPTRAEAGCLSFEVLRSKRDPRLFFIHSRWKDEEAFELHAQQPHTVHFVKKIQALIDHAFDSTRADVIA